MPLEAKKRFLKEYALQWDSPECLELPESAPAHLQQFASHGSNFLSATLFAVTDHAWMADEWVHPETFTHGLHRANYKTIEKEAAPGDVVIWTNKAGIVQHASYHVGNNLFFNKNGQTFFNPWKVIDENELNHDWGHLGSCIPPVKNKLTCFFTGSSYRIRPFLPKKSYTRNEKALLKNLLALIFN